MADHELIAQARYLPVLRCGPCDRAISKGIEETDEQWKLRVAHFQHAHADGAEPILASGFRQGQIAINLNWMACHCGVTLWQEPGEGAGAFVRRAHIWQKEHTHG